MTSLIRRLTSKYFPPPEVRLILAALDDAEGEMATLVFRDVRQVIVARTYANIETTVSQVRGGKRPGSMVYFMIANTARDLVESGEFHIHRGFLDLRGQALLKLFVDALDRLVALNEVSAAVATEQKKQLAARIAADG